MLSSKHIRGVNRLIAEEEAEKRDLVQESVLENVSEKREETKEKVVRLRLGYQVSRTTGDMRIVQYDPDDPAKPWEEVQEVD